jgi:exo-beta-1,3-glucanase (GH17 family)
MRSTIIVVALSAMCYAMSPLDTLISNFTPGNGRVGCLDFSHRGKCSKFATNFLVGPYNWDSNQKPPDSFVLNLLDIILTQTPYRCLMIYDVYEQSIRLAASKGFKVHVIIFLLPDPVANAADNAGDISDAITMYHTYPNTIIGFSCGSELAYRAGGPNDIVTGITMDCITRLKNAGVQVPVGINDSYKTWKNNWTIADKVDFIGANIYVFYDNALAAPTCAPVATAATKTLTRYQRILGQYPNTKVSKCIIL